MANFDALRSAIIGPLEYICRPKVKPETLVALFPLNGSNTNLGLGSATATVASYIGGPFTDSQGGQTVQSLIPVGDAWSLDFYSYIGAYNINITTAGKAIRVANTPGQQIFYYTYNGSAISGNLPYHSWSHLAVTCDGTSLRAYYNGNLGATVTGTASAITISSGGCGVANLRVVNKCISTGSTFPVPSNFYTGYEAL